MKGVLLSPGWQVELEILPPVVKLKNLNVLFKSVGTMERRVVQEDQSCSCRTVVVQRVCWGSNSPLTLSTDLVHRRSNSHPWSRAFGREVWLRLLRHLSQIPPGPREVFRTCPSGRRHRGRPRTLWRNSVSGLDHLRIPQ